MQSNSKPDNDGSENSPGRVAGTTSEIMDAWRAAFTKQLSEPMLARVRSYARQRAHGIARAGGHADDYSVRELVSDAVADTFTGALSWDPERSTLEAHLTRAIQTRTNKERARALKLPHESLGDALEEVERQGARGSTSGPEALVIAVDLIARARVAAARDRDVLRILDAYEALATTRAEVLAYARMRPEKYHRAIIRLSRIFSALTGGTSPVPIETTPPREINCPTIPRAAGSTFRRARSSKIRPSAAGLGKIQRAS